MSLLSERVQESKVYEWNYIPGTTKIAYGTVSPNSGNHYQVFLMKVRESSQFGNVQISYDKIVTECHCNTGNGKVTDCKGNSYHTICKHCLGLIRFHLSLKCAKISFCENVFDAIKLRKPGESLAQIRSAQGRGLLWGVVSEKKDDFAERVNSLRGNEDEQNGID